MNPFRVERSGVPQTPLHVDGRTYLTNCYSSSPTSGSANSMIWLLKDGVAVPSAVVGRTADWDVFQAATPFSVRWQGQLLAPATGDYTFYALASGGARLWVGGQRVVENWPGNSARTSGPRTLEAGKRYDVVMEMHHANGASDASLAWIVPGAKQRAVVPAPALFSSAEATKPDGLTGTYYNDGKLTDKKLTRVDPKLDFRWGEAGPMENPANPFRAKFPLDDKGKPRMPTLFAWSDLNGDAKMQPDEMTFADTTQNLSTCVMADLTVATATGLLLKPTGFTKAGAPIYDAAKAQTLATNTQRSPSSGGNQALYADGWLMLTNAPQPFSASGPGGVYNGQPRWSYPSLWPGLHASHIAPLHDRPGIMIGTTRLLGLPINPSPSVGPMWAINGNKGAAYVMTMDGLFVATLFKDCREASWNFPEGKKDMLVNSGSLGEENFWPSITQTADGEVYMVAQYGSVVRLDGLQKVRRIPDQSIVITNEQLLAAQEQTRQAGVARNEQAGGTKKLTVAMLDKAPAVDGDVSEWKNANWVVIDKRFNSVGNFGRRETTTEAALAVADGRLYVAIKADDAKLLNNSAESPVNLFKTGGAIGPVVLLQPRRQRQSLAAHRRRPASAGGAGRRCQGQDIGANRHALPSCRARHDGPRPLQFPPAHGQLRPGGQRHRQGPTGHPADQRQGRRLPAAHHRGVRPARYAGPEAHRGPRDRRRRRRPPRQRL